jgi:hypothetical protein
MSETTPLKSLLLLAKGRITLKAMGLPAIQQTQKM